MKYSSLWYKKVTKFRSPKVDVTLLLRTLDLNHREDPKAKIFAKMWCSLIRENLRETLYQAELAHIYYSISHNVQGIIFNFHGYNDGLPAFIKEALKNSII